MTFVRPSPSSLKVTSGRFAFQIEKLGENLHGLVLTCEKLNVSLAKVTIVENFNCCVEGGVLVHLLGPNGSGKSTLLGALSKKIRPVSGSIILRTNNELINLENHMLYLPHTR